MPAPFPAPPSPLASVPFVTAHLPTAPLAPVPLMSERRAAILCALLVGMGPLSLTLYSPAMPALAASLGADLPAIQFTVTVYLVGFALAQLVCGPLSDALGRRPVVLAFTAIYLVGTMLCLVAGDVRHLIVGRVVQGIGASGGVAISRAIVRDMFSGQAAARILSVIGMMISLAPAAGQAIGGVILTLLFWRWVFVAMASYSLALAWLMAFRTPETNRDRDRSGLNPLAILGRYRRIGTDAAFLHHALLAAPAMGCLYTYASLMPFVLIGRVGLAPITYGFTMSLTALTYAGMAGWTARLLRHRLPETLELAGGFLMAASALYLVAVVTLLPLSAYTLVPGLCAWAASCALLVPGAQFGCIGPFPTMAGAASALLGFLQMTAGIVGTAMVALLGDAVLGVAVIPTTFAAFGLGAHLLLRAPARRAVSRHTGGPA